MYSFNVGRMFFVVEIVNNQITIINRKETIHPDVAAEEVIKYNSVAMLNNTIA